MAFCSPLLAHAGAAVGKKAKIRVGVQLYSVRKLCETDLVGTLKGIQAMGYAGVEFAGYYGKTAPELKRLLDDNGLVRPSTAVDRYEDSAWGAGLPTEYQSLGGNFIMGRPGDFQNASVSSHYRTYWFEKDVDH